MQMSLAVCGLLSAMIRMTRHVLHEFSCFYTRVQPATANVFPVVANTRTKSIQKQIVEYNIKGKYPEEYSTVYKVGSEKPLASKYCFV